jgi:hypothetical protein
LQTSAAVAAAWTQGRGVCIFLPMVLQIGSKRVKQWQNSAQSLNVTTSQSTNRSKEFKVHQLQGIVAPTVAVK